MPAESEGLVDRFGRRHTYLRLSVTDRCNLRCTYCMPDNKMDWAPRSDLLSFEEIRRIVRIFVELGIVKVRLTGGEPTARAGVTQLVSMLSEISGLRSLTMTTNGLMLPRLARPLADAGLGRINISIDSLRPERFDRLTGGGQLDMVLRGIHSARVSGLCPIRLNTVLLRGQNEDEIMDFVRFVERYADTLQLRFIEYMPFQARAHQCVPGAEVLSEIRKHRTLVPVVPTGSDRGPARRWSCPETGLELGLVSPLSKQFCESCNRLRLNATGQLRTCLAHEDTPSLRTMIRGGATDTEIAFALKQMVLGKKEGHACTVEGGVPFEGVMTGIGG